MTYASSIADLQRVYVLPESTCGVPHLDEVADREVGLRGEAQAPDSGPVICARRILLTVKPAHVHKHLCKIGPKLPFVGRCRGMPIACFC